jgi:cytochrome P450
MGAGPHLDAKTSFRYGGGVTNSAVVTLEDVDLWDMARFARGEEHAMFARLRQEAPLYWHDRPGGESFWAVTGYAEARSILCDPATFSSATERGGMFLKGAGGRTAELPEGVGGPMIETDPPRHQPQRRVLSSTFTPRSVATLEADIRAVTSSCLDRVQEMGEFDFVTEVAHVIPSEVTLSLMGVPRADWTRLADLEHRALNSNDPDYIAGDSGVASMDDALMALGLYFFELLSEKERSGGDDLLCYLLNTAVQGEVRSVVDLVGEAILLMNGGLDTTRAAASAGGLLPLLNDGDQQRLLRQHPEKLKTAVDEFVRWASPIRHVARTATSDAAIGGVTIAEGGRIGIWLGACNRDESVFSHPGRFDVSRDPNPHIGFAFGQHFCLGAHLARLILRIEFEELLSRFSTVELAGEPLGVWSNFVGGLKYLPVRVKP